METRARMAAGHRAVYFLPWLVLAVCLVVTHQLWAHARQTAMRELQTRFDFLAYDTAKEIERRMEAYGQVLRGADGLFAHAGSVTREEFRNYVAKLQLEEYYPGIQGIRFSPLVPRAQKDSYVAAVRRQGFPDYAISPAGERDSYAPVLYIEPYDERNQTVFGYDMLSDLDHPRAGEIAGMRRAAMERARDTGRAALSGKVRLLFEYGERQQAGFLMYMPVYRQGAPHETPAERRAGIVGWVSMVFRMDDIMAGIRGETSTEIDLDIFDGAERAEEALMYDSSGHPADLTALFQSSRTIEIAGRPWRIDLHSLPAFEARVDRGRSRLIGAGGVVTSLMLALLTWLLVHGRELALRAARQMNQELIEHTEELRLAATVFGTVAEAVMVTDADNRVVAVNPSFTRITGYSPDEVIGRSPHMLASGTHPPEFYRELWEKLVATGAWEGEIRNRRKDGEIYVEWLSISRVCDESGRVTHHVAVFSDISERKAAEEHIQHLAHYDVLTDLPNRALFSDRLRQALVKAKRDKTHLALMFLDLDKFKLVNDTLGHDVGDLLLQEVAKRLRDCIRESDSAARIGGDEFVILLPVIEVEQDAMRVAEKIRLALNQPFALAGHSLHISTSIGIAVYPEHGSDETELSRNADTAMYYSKEGGRNNVKLYRPEMKSG